MPAEAKAGKMAEGAEIAPNESHDHELGIDLLKFIWNSSGTQVEISPDA
jgi:hypothetical protein